jgi:SecD/SecF GG Motif
MHRPRVAFSTGQGHAGFRLIPDQARLHLVRYRHCAYVFSAALVALTLILLPTRGLKLGIDFQGGVLIEVACRTRPTSRRCGPPGVSPGRALLL